MQVQLTTDSDSSERRLIDYVRQRMNEYQDPLHDWNHILRMMLNLSVVKDTDDTEQYVHILHRVALLHHMFDRKFLDTEDKLETRRKEVCELLSDSPYANEIVCVAKKISWRTYVQEGVPTFDGPMSVILLRVWKDVSIADWMDAQFVWRAIEHAQYRNPDITPEALKDAVSETQERETMQVARTRILREGQTVHDRKNEGTE